MLIGYARVSTDDQLLDLLMFHLFGALAEFERNLIRERTNAGLTAARTRGKTGGRPKALEPNQRALVVSLYNEKQHSLDEICQMMGISRTTLYTYLGSTPGLHHRFYSPF